MAFEHVYTVWDYYDGPRSGIADYSGRPHHYRCEWNAADDGHDQTFVLTPIDQETLTLAMQQWSIWREWEEAFHRGEVPESTHPALAGSHPRYAELEASIKARLSVGAPHRRRAVAVFRVREGQADAPRGALRELEVEWADVGR
jgi:hypothetical protein